MTLSNKTYDVVNDIVKIGLPAFATLYSGLAILWGFPHGEAVVATTTLVATFLGVWLKILSRRWQENPDGFVSIDVSDPAHATVKLDLVEGDVFEHKDGDIINLKVHSNVTETLEKQRSLDGDTFA